jgi:hypothetical protein
MVHRGRKTLCLGEGAVFWSLFVDMWSGPSLIQGAGKLRLWSQIWLSVFVNKVLLECSLSHAFVERSPHRFSDL